MKKKIADIDWAARRPDPLLHLLQHALGLDDYGRGTFYRNHFVVGSGSPDFDLLDKAVSHGLTARHDPRDLFGGSYCFTVTDAGKAWVREHSPAPPKLTPGQKRYREWLKVADCFGDWSFGDWLKNRKAMETRP